MSRSRLISLGQALIILLILFFWGQALTTNWQTFVTYPWQFNWAYLLGALGLLMLEMVTAASIWWRTLTFTGTGIPWLLGMQLFFRAQIARYLPGGVWDLVGRFALGSQAGVGKRSMAASMGLEMGVQALSGAIFLLAALALRADLAASAYLGLGLAVALLSLLLLSPPIFTSFVNAGLHALKKPRLDMTLTYGGLFQLFLLRILGHLFVGLGFACFVRGIAPTPASLIPQLATSFVGAWLIGYLAFIFPMGVGVRESALVLLISGALPFSVAAVAGVGYRALIAIRDLLTAGVGMAIEKTSG
ncbi:MAG TPA: hypothetical protein G4O05_10205 [Caldilineae bacterium]|nr:hypothetical protein [Caldilineae bacterium]HIQ11521.1 hypothetical protein [Caldilineales bacterium]